MVKEAKMIVTRDIINGDIDFDGYDNNFICKRINKWKYLFKEKYKLQKGDVVCLLIVTVNIDHLASAIACAELGLKILYTNKPVSMETLHATKLAIYGPADLIVHDPDECPHGIFRNDAFYTLIEQYGKKLCIRSEIDSVHEIEDVYGIDATEDDNYVFTSTSGTQSTSRPVYFTHKDFIVFMNMMISSLQMTENSVVYNTVNMHHVASFVGYLAPSVAIANNNRSLWLDYSNVEEFVDKIIAEEVDNVHVSAIFLRKALFDIFEQKKHLFKKRVTFFVTGFLLTEEHHQVSKTLPVNFLSCYGATEIGPVFIDYVDETSEYIPNNLGKLIDGISLAHENDDWYIQSDLWSGEKKQLPDAIEFDGKNYLFCHRTETPRNLEPFDFRPLLDDTYDKWTLIYRDGPPDLIIWNEKPVDFSKASVRFDVWCNKIVFLNEEDFMDSNKVSMEQVRAYIEQA